MTTGKFLDEPTGFLEIDPRPRPHSDEASSPTATPARDAPPSDALVFFGTTGDLARKMIFPALQALVKSGRLGVPIVGVAKADWKVERLRGRAQPGDPVKPTGSLRPPGVGTIRPIRLILTRREVLGFVA